MAISAMGNGTCHCGCGGEATWLITGNDYDPRRLFGVGDPFVDEPACDHAAVYCEELITAVIDLFPGTGIMGEAVAERQATRGPEGRHE